MSALDPDPDGKGTTIHLAICPECDYKELDYTIDARIDQYYRTFMDVDSDSKMKQASIVAANQHNDRTGHSASSYKFVIIGPTEAEKEELRKQKVAILKDIISLFR